MINTELKQLNNFMVVVGDLKAKNLEKRTAQRTGKEYIKGKLIIEVRDGEEVSDIEFEVFSMEGNKNYDGIKNIMNEAIDKSEAMSPEYVTNLRVIGTVEIEDFYNKDNELISYNKYKLIQAFNSTDSHSSELDIEMVIKEIKEDSEGKLILDGFTVGYREEIIDLKTPIDVPMEYSESIKSFYEVGDIAPLKIKVGVAIQEDDSVKSFGIVDNKSYRKHWKLLGGMESKGKFTEDQLKRASDLRLAKLNELKMENESQNVGFGASPQGNIPSSAGFGEQPSSSNNPFM